MDPQRGGRLRRSICMRSCLLLLLSIACIAAADLELSLTNGRTVRGEVVSETDTTVVLRTRFPARGGMKQVESSYAKADILRRKDLPGVVQQYEERKARTPDTVPEQCTLAQWAYENCLREQARTHALRVLTLDTENAWARRILDNCGYMEVDGKWVDEAEHLKANGLVRVDGEIMVAGLADARKAYQRAKMVQAAAKRKLEEMRKVAEEKPRSAAAAEAKSKEATAGLDGAKKAIEEAEAQLSKAKDEPAGKGDDGRKERQDRINKAQQAVTAARQHQRELKDTADKASRAASQDKSSADRAQSALVDLETAYAKAEAELKAAAEKLPTDDPLLKESETVDKAAGTPAAGSKDTPDEPEKPQVRRLRSGGGD